jgi:2-hydroxychromene-2-carboxylate isomerase
MEGEDTVGTESSNGTPHGVGVCAELGAELAPRPSLRVVVAELRKHDRPFQPVVGVDRSHNSLGRRPPPTAMHDHGRMPTPQPLFFLGAMSPYSWFAAERIDRVLPQVRWRGVLAGAIFKANGRTSWGLTDDRSERLADCEARAAEHGLGPIRWPDPWPTSDLLIARAMAHAETRGMLKPFALSAMRLTFLEGADLGERSAVLEAGQRAHIDPAELECALEDSRVKQALRSVTDEALALGVFGVPTVVVGRDLFWGDDRLAEAADAHRAQQRA